MNYRKFGKTDLLVSEVGFGAWAIGGAATVGDTPIGWGQTDDATSKKAIHAALDAGINFFDTADFYGLGHSESLLGDVLQDRKDIVMATKVGHRNLDETIVLDYSKKYILEACEQSLRRLKRGTIDYYQLHSARLPQLQNGECMAAMEQLKQEGKIRYWGLSLNTFFPEPEADYLLEKNCGDGFQLVFNIINQRATETIRKAASKGYGIIARMPLQFGLLTGKFSASSRFEKTDHRSFRLTPDVLQKSLALLQETVWPLAEEEGLSKESLALQYILSYPGISTVIPGIRTEEQVLLNTELPHSISAATRESLQALAADWEPVMQVMEQRG
jgi:aryl-alcohol dehydrogenase-like predicted oxidoreductase